MSVPCNLTRPSLCKRHAERARASPTSSQVVLLCRTFLRYGVVEQRSILVVGRNQIEKRELRDSLVVGATDNQGSSILPL
jgi:hypothetical protein